MHVTAVCSRAVTALTAGLLALTLAPAPAAEAQANPVYRICLATASVGTGTYTDSNYLQRFDPDGVYSALKIWEGQCKDLTFGPNTYLRHFGYNSFRVTSDLGAPGNSSTYRGCVSATAYRPPGDRKVKGYQRTNCTNWSPGE